MGYTNEGLVKHAEKALALNTKYMWGGILRTIEKQYDLLYKTYGISPKTGYTAERWAELKKLFGKGYYGVDCVGLIKSYYWSGDINGGTGSPRYSSSTDVNAGAMYMKSSRKGTVKNMPDIPGLIVYSKSHPHVGIYIGNGYTIESTLGARGDGVTKRKFDSFWEYWFECPYIKYKDKSVFFSDEKAATKKYTVAFPATLRSKPSASAEKIGRYTPGSTVTVVTGSEKTDSKTGYVYVRVAGERESWIVKSALK